MISGSSCSVNRHFVGVKAVRSSRQAVVSRSCYGSTTLRDLFGSGQTNIVNETLESCPSDRAFPLRIPTAVVADCAVIPTLFAGDVPRDVRRSSPDESGLHAVL
jgi:hypothetical protein